MNKKLLTFSITFLATAAIIAAVSFLTTYAILRHTLVQKLAGQERASELIAEQIKSANLNSILAFTDQYYIFILHLRDGRILFESALRSGDALNIWEGNKDEIIKELLAKRTGALTYPSRKAWQFFSPLFSVVYIYLPDLDWIVATELPASIGFAQLVGVYSPWVWGLLFIFSLCFAGYMALLFKKDAPKPFSQAFEAPPLPAKPADKVHPVHTLEYTQRLVSVAQKALESEKIPPQEIIVQESKPEEKLIEEIEIKDHIKDASEKLRQEEAAVTQTPVKEESAPTQETKKAAEIYFERMMSDKKSKKDKPKPASIIGLALSKKKNREELNS